MTGAVAVRRPGWGIPVGMRTKPIGSIIGAIAGLVFVLVNAGTVPASLVWRVVAIAGFVAIIWFVVLRGPEIDQLSPDREALRTYAMAVTAMVVAIPVGASIISNRLDRPNAVLVWVVFVVGAHFLPFAHAFQLPIFYWLSASLILVSLIGALPTLASNSVSAAGWTGVIAGFVLMLFAAVGPRLSRRATMPRR